MTGGCAFTGELSAWAMPLHAARPQEAEKFALWLSSAEGARAWAEGGGLPAQVDALSGLPASVPAAMRETAAALARAGCYPLAFPATLPSEALWKALHQAAHDAAAGAQTPRQALTTAAQAMRAALRKEGDIP
jgi:ABC-type glycerol-3-phosphate transport system substrate-binding protein